MFIGNADAFDELLVWLREGTGVCLLSGSTGCGKTYGVYAAARIVGLAVTLFDTSTCLNGKDFKDKFTKATQSDILAQLTHTVDGQRLIFIDELDALLTIDRTFLLNLKCLPDNIQVVIAGTSEAVRRVGITGMMIDIHSPSDDDISNMLKEYNKLHHLHVSAKIMTTIAKVSNGSIATALRHMNTNHDATEDAVKSRMDTFDDIGGVYRSPERVAHDVLSIDPWLNVLRYHENIIHELKQRDYGAEADDDMIRRYVGSMGDLCDWVLMMGWCPEYAVQFMATSCRARMSPKVLPLKPDALPPTTQFTRMINIMSARKKGLNSLYTSINTKNRNLTFPWYQVGSMEKSFLSKR